MIDIELVVKLDGTRTFTLLRNERMNRPHTGEYVDVNGIEFEVRKVTTFVGHEAVRVELLMPLDWFGRAICEWESLGWREE